MKGRVKTRARELLTYPARGLAAARVSPNHLTLAGLALSGIAGVVLGRGRFGWASLFLILAGLCDMLDGAVARTRNQSSLFGAHLDSTVDRLAEAFVFGGALYFFHHTHQSLYVMLAYFAIVGSFLISYTRARAEGLGLECNVGLMERPERIVLLIVALWFGVPGLKVVLWVLTPLAFYTSWQRILHVYRSAQ